MTRPPTDDPAGAGETLSLTTGADPPDEAAGCVPGNDGAIDIAATVSEFESRLLRYAAAMIGSGADQAEDVVQEVFLRLHRQTTRRRGAEIKDLSRWLFRVAHNLAIDRIRRNQTRRRAKEAMADQAAAEPVEQTSTIGLVERRESAALAMAQLEKLPPQLRQVVHLKVIDGMSLREICALTGLTVGNAGYRLHKGLSMITERLKTNGPPERAGGADENVEKTTTPNAK